MVAVAGWPKLNPPDCCCDVLMEVIELAEPCEGGLSEVDGREAAPGRRPLPLPRRILRILLLSARNQYLL